MSYIVNHTDGTRTIQVNDGTLNKDTSLSLVGKNFYGYGEHIAENQLHLLENFANTSAPANPVQGQIWYDAESEFLKVWNGTTWTYAAAPTVRQIELLDEDGSTSHTVTGIYDENDIIAVVSGSRFNIHENDSNFETFNENLSHHIKAGITLKEGLLFHGTASSARYADLAENYTSDAEYTPGTVIKIGGESEVTQTTDAFCPDVFGIVSTNPAYLMNSTIEGTAVAVALEGRVPCRVIGPVRKGQRLVSSETPGVARAVSDYERQEALDWYRIVGRALADKTTEGEDLLEVVVGAK